MARDLEARVRERLSRVFGAPSLATSALFDGPAPPDRFRFDDGRERPEREPRPAGLITPAEAIHAGGRRLGRSGVRALAAAGAVVLIGAAFLAWRARPIPEPAPMASAGPIIIQSGQSTMVVAITGRVRRPGLVRLSAGARVADAIEAAGGVVPGTDLSFVNVARRVTDGELIVIGVAPPGAVAAGGTAAGGGSPTQVNLNTATTAQLETLPGVGPTLALRIVEYREKHGGFRSVSELRQVDGIGDARFAELKDRVVV